MKKLKKEKRKNVVYSFTLIFIDRICFNVVHSFLTDFVKLLHCVGVIYIDEKLYSKLIFLVTPLVNKIIITHKFDQ